MTSLPLFQNTFILRRLRAAIFADIIKIVTTFFKTIFKDLKKVKKKQNYVSTQSISVFLDIAKLIDFQ